MFGGTTAGFGGAAAGRTGGGNNNNEILVQGARSALENLKNQTASELGIQNYAQQYKGDLPSRVNGSVGGFMVKKMIALAEQQLSGGAAGTTIGR
jgi:small acid-soluble spore protein A (major alpha-type SASP)